MVRVVFRVDAYEEIALGHLTRCISLAHALKEQGASVHFVIFNDDESVRRLERAGYSYETREYKLGDHAYAHDVEFFKSSGEYEVIIIDSYFLDDDYFSGIKECFPTVVYIDDLGHDYPVDVVVNSSCRARSSDYQAPVALLGMQYLILDRYYWDQEERRASGEVGSIMITMGGVDHYDFSSTLLPVIEAIRDDLVINIVVGPYYTNTDSIHKAVEESGLEVHLYVGLNNISEVVGRCDIGVSAGGFTIYELASASVPSVGIALWENQNSNIECLAGHDAILPVYYGESALQEVAAHLKRLVMEEGLREGMVERGRAVLDGQGARRIAERILGVI